MRDDRVNSIAHFGGSVKRSVQSSSYHHQSHFSDDKNEMSTVIVNQMHPEDVKISRLLRRLQAESNGSIALELCNKLELAIRSQSNASYICRTFDFLVENMIAVLRQCPVECLEKASTVLGIMGYINRKDFLTYKNHILKTYELYKSIRKFVMLALKTTLSCDAVSLDLVMFSERLLEVLKNFLENAEDAETFIAISDTIHEFSKNYKGALELHFTDIVDIIVGWHLEYEQPSELKLHCSLLLQQFGPFFLKELDFTFGLLTQFIEDILSLGEEISIGAVSDRCLTSAGRLCKVELRIGCFVGAFNSILKSLANRHEFVGLIVGHDVINEAIVAITKICEQVLAVTLASEETILNINDFFCLIFSYNNNVVNLLNIEKLIDLEMKQLQYFGHKQKLSLLYLILSVFRKLRTSTPLSTVRLVFTVNNPLSSIRFSNNCVFQRMLLKIYHEVLMIKNVPLLQEAYKHIIIDIDNSIVILETRNNVDHQHEVVKAESTLNFYLTALSALATQTSSIISMYALYPPILELLISNCKAAAKDLWCQHPSLHNALLNVLIVHCQKNHNFRPTSRLLMEPLNENNSRTSENFTMILQFLAAILSMSLELSITNLSLLLGWTKGILTDCRENAEVLVKNENFLKICKCISNAAMVLPLECAACIEVTLEYAGLDVELLEYFRDVAVLMLDTRCQKKKTAYTVILAKLPITISLGRIQVQNAIQEKRTQLCELLQWYKSTVYFAPMRNKFFKPFLEHIENIVTEEDTFDPDGISRFVENVFTKCWVARNRENALEYELAVRESCCALELWIQYEAGRQCVRNKLRTSIGKPQDTFLAIEAIITKYARVLSTGIAAVCESKTGEKIKLHHLIHIQRNTRMLLGFLESLEKHIYNAAEGTAFAIPPLDKPAKTFFRINAHTCNEWFNRIRPSVNLIAMHSMVPEMVIRNAETILRKDKLSDIHLEHTVISLVWALLTCDESYTLQGLYLWLKAKSNHRFVWVQFAADQAAGRKEQAADGYESFLKDHESTVDSRIREFVIDQLLHCLYYTAQWSRMRHVINRYKLRYKQDNMQFINMRSEAHLTLVESLIDCYDSMSNLTLSDDVSNAIMDLSKWPQSEEKHRKIASTESFSYYYVMRQLEDACVAHVLRSGIGENSTLNAEVEEGIQKEVQSILFHDRIWERNSLITDPLILNYISQRLTTPNSFSDWQNLHGLSSDFYGHIVPEQSTFSLKTLFWTLLFQRSLQENIGSSHHVMYLDVSNNARREGNIFLCRSMLQRFFNLKGFSQRLPEISEQVRLNSCIINVRDTELIRGFSELVKCSSVNVNNQLSAISLGASYCRQIIEQMAEKPDLNFPLNCADMLLTLADWLSSRSGSSTNSVANNALNSPQLQQLLQNLPDVTVHVLSENQDNIDTLIPPIEKAVGKLINASIFQNKHSGDAWCAFGNWCYRWGKKLMEAKNTENCLMKGGLPPREMNAMKDVLGCNISDDVITQLMNILNAHQLNITDTEEDIEKSEISSTELIEKELRRVEALADKPSDQIASIIKIWRQAHRNVYVYYEMATKAYFNYLTIETNQGEKKQNVSDCSSVTTTLRLLRLIVKYAAGLQEVLEEGLRTTPLRPWKVIIPQLFSRLNHHEPYVRKSVSDLLCRLALDRPHLIIFPAVVGAHQELKVATPFREHSSENFNSSDSYLDVEKKSSILSTCFRSLVQTLAKQAPETVTHVQLLVKELKRVTLLWEEYWVHSLSQIYSEYAGHFNTLEAELKKNPTALSDKVGAKYEILMKHLGFDMKRIAAVTEKKADTNYERCFQERYSALIISTLDELQKPFNIVKPFEGWIRIKQLYSIFQQRSLRGYASTLKIADLSPVLENMRNTAISMPGVDTFEKEPVYIKSVENTVHILPTKTKPKKLAFYGSDGRKYTYLFKGLEDLHLDERIMQFLSISNSMMARAGGGSVNYNSGSTASDTMQHTNNFRAHHYSVIPLGSQSGLISWVDGVTPLFAIYKKWQQRDATLKQQQKERQANTPLGGQQATVPTATRPSELFYSKLTPLLAEHGIKVTDSRKLWPLATLRRVLEELIKETPKDLLAKELWCYASTAADWRKSVRNYSISMAVMSVIGYVIGLGDRHLDNVLIKLTTGEIVHIDYNVCFEKGKTLRVPEKVPFRMTPNLEEALGLTGIEGTFRLGCEHVLKILRKERETLLTLLEAFVYDPLVDWTVSDDGTTTVTRVTSAHAAGLSITSLDVSGTLLKEGGNTKSSALDDGTRKKLNGECTRQAIVLRFNELRPFWLHYQKEVHSKLLEIDAALDRLGSLQADIRREEHERDCLSKQLAMIREMEALGSAMGSHALNTITDRYNTCKRDAETFNQLKTRVQHFLDDTSVLVTNYFEHLLVAPVTGELTALKVQLVDEQYNVPANEFELLRALLEASGQEQLYSQCDFTRKEMDNTVYQQARCMLECIDLLQQYAHVMQFYPRSKLIQHPLIKYKQWYSKLLQDEQTVDELQQQLLQCTEFKNQISEEASKIYIHQYAKSLEKVWMEENIALGAAINDLNAHSNQVLIPLDVATGTIHTFVSMEPLVHKQLIQSCMLETLATVDDSFMFYEESVLNGERPHLLCQQLNFIELLQKMYRVAFPDEQKYESIQLLDDVLQSVRMLESLFELSMPERIVRLFMLDNMEKLQDKLTQICTFDSKNYCEPCEYKLKEDTAGIEDFIALYDEMHGLFEEIELRLKLLEPTVETIVSNLTDSNIKQFVSSRYLLKNLVHLNKNLKYDVIGSVFRLARDAVKAIKCSDVEHIYDVRRISAPTHDYIKALQRNILSGLPTLFAHVLQRNFSAVATQHNLQCNDAATLLNAENLCQNMLLALKQDFSQKNLHLQVLLYTKLVEHYGLIGTAHFWANANCLRNVQLMYGCRKDKLLQSLQTCTHSLDAWKHTMLKIKEDVDEYAAAVIQHLNWALQTNSGNENLMQLKERFFECAKSQDRRYNVHLHAAIQLLQYTQALFQFELLEDSEQCQKAGNAFTLLLEQWKDAQINLQLSSSTITPVEHAIVQLLDPEGKVDKCWRENIIGLLDDMMFGVQRKLAQLEQETKVVKECLYDHGQQLLPLLETHLRMDLRHLLKAMCAAAPTGSTALEKNAMTTRVRELQHNLKCFHVKLNEIQTYLLTRNISDIPPVEFKLKVSDLQTIFDKNGLELLELINRYILCESGASSPRLESPSNNQNNDACESYQKGAAAHAETVLEECGSGDKKGEQKRNAYAVSVWKRVRMKLEGRDPDSNRRSSIAEQVDYIIHEARNADNLAVLYEGWTPWV